MKSPYRGQVREITLYIVFGVLTTLINVATYALLARVVGVDYLVSNAVAWIVSVLFAHVTNKFFVFRSMVLELRKALRELASFVGSRALTGLLDMGLMYLLVDVLDVNDLWSKVGVNALVVVLNYVLGKYYVFANRDGRTESSRCRS